LRTPQTHTQTSNLTWRQSCEGTISLLSSLANSGLRVAAAYWPGTSTASGGGADLGGGEGGSIGGGGRGYPLLDSHLHMLQGGGILP